MVIIGKNYKPKGVIVQIRDDVSKSSKSFTVHNMSFNKLFYRLLHYCQQLQEHDEVELICYKKGDNTCQKEN